MHPQIQCQIPDVVEALNINKQNQSRPAYLLFLRYKVTERIYTNKIQNQTTPTQSQKHLRNYEPEF